MKKVYLLIYLLIISINFQVYANPGINCGTNIFWAIHDTTGAIEEFEINGNTIISHGIIVNFSPGFSLAFCNNLNGGAFSPTFYSTIYELFPQLQYFITFYNGSSWDTANVNLPLPSSGCGGAGDYLYFSTLGIERYDGAAVIPLASNASMIADVAVDSMGNAWMILDSNFIASEVRVINPADQIIKTFNVNFNAFGAYGCFLLNNILYVGLDYANTVFPNTLLPISFSGNTATLGTPISMPSGSFNDLASCSPGFMLASIHEPTSDQIKIYPNPSRDIFNFKIPEHIKEISIINILGQQILCSTDTRINLSPFPDGIYFYTLTTEHGNLFQGKIVKFQN
jgi:hypothetical protein